MTQLPKITPAPNGPLIVENPPNLISAVEMDMASKLKVALCRCGASGNKPFCDRAHAKIGFDSTPNHTHLRNTPLNYSGTVGGVDVTVSYSPALCTHAAQCQARAVSVFDPALQP